MGNCWNRRRGAIPRIPCVHGPSNTLANQGRRLPPCLLPAALAGSDSNVNRAPPDGRPSASVEIARAESLSASHTEILESNLREFSLIQLERATNQFSPEFFLGKGASAKVFKGWFGDNFEPTTPENGQPVAVKMISNESSSEDDNKHFLAEVTCGIRCAHPNIIRLLGYCSENNQHLLVYEYMEGGSLADQISDSAKFHQLSWESKMRIAVGAARGLAYLHSRHIIHRDMKSANILLDSENNPKLSDFGCAIEAPTSGKNYVHGESIGTIGYMAYEALTDGRYSTKSDVVAFGIILLEIIMGRKSIDENEPEERRSLIEWMKSGQGSIDREKIYSELALRSGENHLLRQEADGLAKLVQDCMAWNPGARPDMSRVVAALQQQQLKCVPSEEPKTVKDMSRVVAALQQQQLKCVPSEEPKPSPS